MTRSAPSGAAISRRYASMSTTMIRAGSKSRAEATAHSPTGPAPKMTTVSPGRTPRLPGSQTRHGRVGGGQDVAGEDAPARRRGRRGSAAG